MFGKKSAAAVPTALGSLVSAVLGLNNIGKMKSTLQLPSSPQYLVSYTPTQFQTIYFAKSEPAATNASIAVTAGGT